MKPGLQTSARLLCLTFLLVGCDQESSETNNEASLEQAWRQYSFGAYEAATKTFSQIARREPEKSPPQILALYGQATVWDLRRPGQNPQKATALHQQIIKLNPQAEVAAWSRLALARMQALVPVGQQPDLQVVSSAYQSVIDLHPGTLAADEALLLQQTALLLTYRPEDVRSAITTLGKFIVTRPESRFLFAGHTILAECHRALGQPDERLAEEIKSLNAREKIARREWEKNPTGDFQFADPAAAFKIANIAEFEAGDFATARFYYRLFMKGNPLEKRIFYAQQALERMDLLEAKLRAQPPYPNPS